ncbi:hypothetical protein CPLU01_14929 [Colletotrichum plurivorum]|uniref:Uncharacterized protein n=1 Tax=Colletotrichum plurivorum TaxID=2175906 RepID=A0A8H6JG22_9PEZI|nr:hypothetical protein CPLU01_14929 [Colletotrichum plurivorum]
MKSFAIFSILLLAGCKAVAGEYRPKEELVLADCGIGTRPNGDSTSRQFAYYSAGRSPGRDTNGPDHWVNPDMIANVPWDGSYPWRNSGVDVKLPNNDRFHIWINPAIKDWSSSNKQYAGGASHIFEPHPFQCWGGHGRHVFNLADGTKCTSAYICGHETDAVPQPPKQENSVKFTMAKRQVTVRVQGTNKEVENWLPRNALGHANDAIEGIQCKSQSYQIGSDCKISFECKFGAPGRAGTLARVLTDAVAPEVAKTKATKKGRYPGKCRPDGGCEPDYEFEYTEYQYPVDGTVLVSHKTPGDDNSEGVQNFMTWNIQCNNNGFCGAFCDGFKKYSTDVVGGI